MSKGCTMTDGGIAGAARGRRVGEIGGWGAKS
jgi:hypothetical protein